jgi:hypothetical protein
MGRASLTIIALAIAALASPLAQQAPDAARVLLVTVADALNRPIVDLDVDDFVVSQGDERREIFAVWIADYPIVLLVDNSATSQEDLAAARQAAARFVARIGDRAVAVLTLTQPAAVLASFDDTRETVLARVEDMPAAPASPLAPLQALATAAQMIRETGTSFSSIVLMSARPLGAEEAEPPGFLTSFLESRAILHVVSMGVSGTSLGSPTLRSEGLLRSLANRTGGRHALIYSPVSFQVALDQIADRLATEMMIEYLVSSNEPSDLEVRVGATVPGARVHGLGVSR